MGSFEFGIYVYVWTWVLLLGELVDLGLATVGAALHSGISPSAACSTLLRGFLSGSRWLAIGDRDRRRAASVRGAACWLLEPWLDRYLRDPALSRLPDAAGLRAGSIQDGIARCYDWIDLALMPAYVIRQLLLTVADGGRLLR